MRLPSLIAAAVGAGLCIAPASVHWSAGDDGAVSLTLQAAQAAELAIAPYEGPRRRGYTRYYRTALYHPLCGGPYVGGGWNGGSYYGGPWMDLRCYGLLR
jgi:hypothetical protein